MILKNLLLAYQLEGYNHIRFLKFSYTHLKFWFYGSNRQRLDWTAKAKLIFCITLILLTFVGCISYLLFGVYVVIYLIITILALPIFFIISHICVYPLDFYLKHQIIKKAQRKISSLKNLQVIAITGSMGKTTTKEILKTTLSESYTVLATEGTKNTPLGISRLILSELNESHEIFIVEMGAYTQGNIAELCKIVKPNISVITGITLQHLERFKSLDNIIDAKFEILESLSENDFAVVDIRTEGVKKGLSEKHLGVKDIVTVEPNIPYTYKENLEGMIFDFHGEKIETKLLADYIGSTLQICYEIGKHLGQDLNEFKKGVKNIGFIEHRMQLIHNPQNNIYVLDDSFNGNIEGIKSIIHLLKKAPFSGRKILVAGGIVELGDKTEEIHRHISKDIGDVADMVLLVEGPVGNALEKGLIENNYSQENIKKYSDTISLHEDIGSILQDGDLIIFQNDLPDHYL